MHLFLKKIYRKNPFPKIYRINQCEVLTTHRKELKTYLTFKEWLTLGIDLLLGAPVDKGITQKELMFLPNQLSEQLSQYQINGQPLLGTSRVIVKGSNSTITKWRFFKPLYCSILVLFCLLFLVLKDVSIRPKIVNLLYFTLGLSGLLLLFLWFGTRHAATQMNYNLLWLNPLFLLLPFLKNGVVKRGLIIITTFAISLLLIFWVFIPQVLNIAIIPLLLVIFFLSFSKLKA